MNTRPEAQVELGIGDEMDIDSVDTTNTFTNAPSFCPSTTSILGEGGAPGLDIAGSSQAGYVMATTAGVSLTSQHMLDTSLLPASPTRSFYSQPQSQSLGYGSTSDFSPFGGSTQYGRYQNTFDIPAPNIFTGYDSGMDSGTRVSPYEQIYHTAAGSPAGNNAADGPHEVYADFEWYYPPPVVAPEPEPETELPPWIGSSVCNTCDGPESQHTNHNIQYTSWGEWHVHAWLVHPQLEWKRNQQCYWEEGCDRKVFETLEKWLAHNAAIHQKSIHCEYTGCEYAEGGKAFGKKEDKDRHYRQRHEPKVYCGITWCEHKDANIIRTDKAREHDAKFHGQFPCMKLSCFRGIIDGQSYGFQTQKRLAEHMKNDNHRSPRGFSGLQD